MCETGTGKYIYQVRNYFWANKIKLKREKCIIEWWKMETKVFVILNGIIVEEFLFA